MRGFLPQLLRTGQTTPPVPNVALIKSGGGANRSNPNVITVIFFNSPGLVQNLNVLDFGNKK